MPSQPSTAEPINRQQMRESFNKAAQSYDQAAILQRRVADQLLQNLRQTQRPAQRILDLGCGTGYLSAGLRDLYPDAELIALDIAPAMLQQARQRCGSQQTHYLCADAYRLPLRSQQFDLLVSSLMLQWCPQIEQVFQECARLLKAQGRLFFSTFGPSSLSELRQSWAQVDDKPHVHEFLPVAQLHKALSKTGFVAQLETKMEFEYQADLRQVMRSLKNIGAHNVAQQRRQGLLGKQSWQTLQQAYEKYRTAQGLPMSYEIIYASATLI